MNMKFIIEAKEGMTLELSHDEARSLQKLLGNLRVRDQLGLNDSDRRLFREIHSLLFQQYGPLI
jgi:hypothetical protein